MHRIVKVLLPFWSGFNELSDCAQVDFQLSSFNFYPVWTTWFWHALSLSFVVLILKGLHFGSYLNLHEFSNCRCDKVCIWYNDNFLTRGCSNSRLQAVFRVWPPDYTFPCYPCINSRHWAQHLGWVLKFEKFTQSKSTLDPILTGNFIENKYYACLLEKILTSD